MDRRTFLGLGVGLLGTCGFGSVVTNRIGRMPPRAQVVVQPWNEGRLRVSSFTVKVGATKPFRTVHFSDTHINLSDIEEMYASDNNYKAGSVRYARFPQAIPSFYATLDFAEKEAGTLLLHTGDLIDFGTRACYDFLRHNLMKVDLIYAIGNHEFERPDSSYDPDPEVRVRALAAAGLVGNLGCLSRVVNGVNFVAFDNARFGRGIIAPHVRSAIAHEFEKGLPVVLACHIPPYTSKAFAESRLQGLVDFALQRDAQEDIEAYLSRPRQEQWTGDAETIAFWRTIADRENFKAVLCGHRHWAWHEAFGRGMCYIAGGNYEGCVNEFCFC